VGMVRAQQYSDCLAIHLLTRNRQQTESTTCY